MPAQHTLRLLLPETYNSRRAAPGAGGTFPILRLRQAGEHSSLNYHWLLSRPKPPGLEKGRQAAGERQDKMSFIGSFKTVLSASLSAAWVHRRGAGSEPLQQHKECKRCSPKAAVGSLRGQLPLLPARDRQQVTRGMSPAPLSASSAPAPSPTRCIFDSSKRSNSCQMKYLPATVLRG